MTDRARESTFNMLESLVGVRDARVLDLYAGSGSLGLEALSRGAARVTFVEGDRRAAATLAANVSVLGFGDRCELRVTSVQQAVASLAAADVAFCDPPYADDPWIELLGGIPAPVVVAHTERDVGVPSGWEVLRHRRYGRATITILERGGEPDPGHVRDDSAPEP